VYIQKILRNCCLLYDHSRLSSYTIAKRSVRQIFLLGSPAQSSSGRNDVSDTTTVPIGKESKAPIGAELECHSMKEDYVYLGREVHLYHSISIWESHVGKMVYHQRRIMQHWSALPSIKWKLICVVASSCSTKTTLGISSVEYLG
jgi:hypothetical protein